MTTFGSWWAERSKRPLLVAGAALLAAGTLAWMPADASPVLSRSAADKPAFTATKTITRTFVDADGTPVPQVSNTVTVNADQTENLRGRQRITISWSGAQPSGGRASNPFGEKGLQQEYPVVIMQCRGLDDATLPAAQQLSPETCWTASLAQRSQIAQATGEDLWTRDLDASADYRQPVSGLDPLPPECAAASVENHWTRLTPFRAASGKVYPACSAETMPPEAAVGAAYPPAEIAAFTDADGNGSVKFEVRSDVENESLGCNDKTACSIVVVPIAGLSCAQPSAPASPADNACRLSGQYLPGSSNFAGQGVDQAVSPSLWWAPSNWKNRFSIPITFGLPPDTCDVLDPRAPTGFYGSELLAQASLQWSPAYCLDKKRFKFQHNQMSDEAGFNLMENGGGAAAVVSSAHKRKGEDPVGYAPTAVTGFGISYVIDRPDNAGELTNLRLNARLLAKLMTQSYLGSDLGKGHPGGLEDNPLALMTDPEFVKLNPGLSQIPQEAGAALLSLSNPSDVIEQLTDYVSQDKDAMAFIDGKPDPWGMKVNPSYKKIKMPRSDWPLLDQYVPQTQLECRQKNPGVYFTQLAAPVVSMRKIAEAMLDAWPNVQTKCDFDTVSGLFKVGRIDRQSFGARFMLGIVSLGDAARYGLRTASLETAKGSYVAPSTSSMAAALQLAEQDKKYDPFAIDQSDIRKSKVAYPGTMVVYTAARLRNLTQEDADKVAQFIRVSTTEGQEAGTGNGELPEGFLPIVKKGVTADLWNSAQEVAEAVEKQKPAPAEEPSGTPTGIPTGEPVTSSGGDTRPVVPVAPPSADAPVASTAPVAPSPTTVETTPVAMPATEAISSRAAGGVVPSLLIIGLVGIAVASLLRFLAQRPRTR